MWPISWVTTASKSYLPESIPSLESKSKSIAELNPIAGGGPKPGGSNVGSELIKPRVRYTAEGARTLVVSPRCVGMGVKFGSSL